MPPLATHAGSIDAGQEEEGRGDGQRDKRELPVEQDCDGDHHGEGDRSGDRGNDPIDQILDRRHVMLDSIEGVGGATRVVIRHGEALDLVHEPGAEIEDEPFADVGLQQRARKPLELAERRDGNEQANREQQDRGGGLRGAFREERLQEHGQWVPTEDRIHRNFERHRGEERHGAREQPKPEQAREVEPVRARLLQQPPVQDDVAHHAPPSWSRFKPRAIVAMAAVHCWSVRSAGNRAMRPRTAAAGQAWW